jgi:Putative CRISPR-associated protein (Cas_VVA1548)
MARAKQASNVVVVGRDPEQVALYEALGIAPQGCAPLDAAKVGDVERRWVVGQLPLHLAAHATHVTVVPMRLSEADRGRRLSADEMRERAAEPVTVCVDETARIRSVDLIVTRHPALVALASERGISAARVISHVDDPARLRGLHVCGVLPLELAAEAASVTEIPLTVPRDRWGVELPLDELRGYAGRTSTYEVQRLERRYRWWVQMVAEGGPCSWAEARAALAPHDWRSASVSAAGQVLDSVWRGEARHCPEAEPAMTPDERALCYRRPAATAHPGVDYWESSNPFKGD